MTVYPKRYDGFTEITEGLISIHHANTWTIKFISKTAAKRLIHQKKKERMKRIEQSKTVEPHPKLGKARKGR